MQSFIIKSIYYAVILLFVVGCDKSDNDKPVSEQAKEQIARALTETKSLFDDFELSTSDKSSLTGMAKDEVDKLFAVEYKVIELERAGDTQAIENELNTLGKERWDCFAVQSNQNLIVPDSNGKIRLFCKRRPQTYLRYLTRTF